MFFFCLLVSVKKWQMGRSFRLDASMFEVSHSVVLSYRSVRTCKEILILLNQRSLISLTQCSGDNRGPTRLCELSCKYL